MILFRIKKNDRNWNANEKIWDREDSKKDVYRSKEFKQYLRMKISTVIIKSMCEARERTSSVKTKKKKFNKHFYFDNFFLLQMQ